MVRLSWLLNDTGAMIVGLLINCLEKGFYPAMLNIVTSLITFLILSSPIGEVRTLLEQGQPQTAFEVASKYEDEWAGEAEFDFYYGVAALESGHPQYASMAFERILMRQDNPRVRLEFARSLYVLGDLKAARQEFQTVLSVEPPVEVTQRVNIFLSAIDTKLKRQARHWNHQLGWNSGFDSNVNSAANTSFEATIFGQVPVTLFPSDDTKKQSDAYNEIGLSSTVNVPVSQRLGYFVNAGLEGRMNTSSSHFDSLNVSMGGGGRYQFKQHRFRWPVSVQSLWVDGEESRKLLSVGSEWSLPVGTSRQVSASMQVSGIRFPNNARYIGGIKQADNHQRDLDQAVLGLGLWQNLSSVASTVQGNLMVGLDHARGRDSGGNDIYGKTFVALQLAAQYRPWVRHVLQVRLLSQGSEYEEIDPRFPTAVRSDLFTNVSVDWQWLASKKLKYGASFDYSDNHSNLDNYDYDRFKLSIGVDYLW